MKILIDIQFSLEEKTYFMKLFKLHKSFLLLLSDNREMGIGSVFLSSPSTLDSNTSSNSYNLFGVKDKLLGKILAENAAKKLKSPIMLMLFISSEVKENDIIKPLLVIFNEKLENYRLTN